MLGELVPLSGGDSIPLLEPKLVIGRRSRCDIVLAYPNVSSEHCELEFSSGFWLIRDLGSRNGVKVNGERCDQKWLQPGDQISIAANHFEIEYEPTGVAPPEEENPFEMGLLEKAGLQSRDEERRVQKAQRKNAPPPPPPTRRVNKRSFGDEEDAAMDWLMGDD